MDVEMGHALADMVVDGNKGPFGRHADFHGMRNELDVREQGADQIGRKIDQGLVMLLWDQQTVPGEERPVVQKSQGQVVLKDNRRLQLSPDDPAKFA
jgi:hypothetical protein